MVHLYNIVFTRSTLQFALAPFSSREWLRVSLVQSLENRLYATFTALNYSFYLSHASLQNGLTEKSSSSLSEQFVKLSGVLKNPVRTSTAWSMDCDVHSHYNSLRYLFQLLLSFLDVKQCSHQYKKYLTLWPVLMCIWPRFCKADKVTVKVLENFWRHLLQKTEGQVPLVSPVRLITSYLLHHAVQYTYRKRSIVLHISVSL